MNWLTPFVVFASSYVLLIPQLHADWLTLPGSYSHDALTGQRLTQYAPVEAPVVAQVSNFRSSGYTHTRSSLNYGQSADNYHRVEAWGDPVRPYGEWRFPFRPYGTPYPNWGPPLAGLGGIGIGAGFVTPPIGFAPLPADAGGQPPGSTPPATGFRNRFRRPNPAAGTNGFAPYPSGRGTPYPVAPYYDGYHPNYRD
ncbi:MAG: hypothetical protein AAGJ40_01895 [Planctomycetota bacterium]